MANVPRVTFVSWIQRYGCVEFVVGSLTYPRRGGEGASLSVPVFPWDFHKTQPYQVSIRSKNAPLASQALITASTYSGSRLSTSAKKFQVLGSRLRTRILVRAMIGLLKIPF